MSRMSDAQILYSQYKTADPLNIRIAFHQKYSLQKKPFSDWLFSHYAFFPGMRILEIGCGSGALWQGKLHTLPTPECLILTDLSPGMVAETRAALGETPFLSFRTADIQALPFPDGYFDLVIANMMLYHVPDLAKGLSEVRRVLKTGGYFHCATSGAKTVVDYLREMLAGEQVLPHLSFTLQNGESLLRPFFSEITRFCQQDALLITDPDDLMAYIHSLACMSGLDSTEGNALRRLLESRMENGVLHIPKEYGTFRCRK
ncbi:MAG: class I SAM-dependent methyltransferase [Clostridia bacterium]|nr:class I SAM-dependent methyltransferase [Clostridia bacterium]